MYTVALYCTCTSYYYTCTPIAAKTPRKTRAELAKFVDADYYGYRDEEDGIIVPLEQEQESKGLALSIYIYIVTA